MAFGVPVLHNKVSRKLGLFAMKLTFSAAQPICSFVICIAKASEHSTKCPVSAVLAARESAVCVWMTHIQQNSVLMSAMLFRPPQGATPTSSSHSPELHLAASASFSPPQTAASWCWSPSRVTLSTPTPRGAGAQGQGWSLNLGLLLAPADLGLGLQPVPSLAQTRALISQQQGEGLPPQSPTKS